jgi:hypothetical protein
MARAAPAMAVAGWAMVLGAGSAAVCIRAGEGGVVLRGERKRASSSPPSLSSSASHRLLAAFLVRLAGGGEGFGEESGECSGCGDSGSGCSGTARLCSAVGDFTCVGVREETGECSGQGGSGSGYSDPVCWAEWSAISRRRDSGADGDGRVAR